MSNNELEDPNEKEENTYIIDVRQGRETARLLEQGRMLTEALGGPFPKGFSLAGVKKVLDMACGPGEWAGEVALTYPTIEEIVGIDIDKYHIEYARSQASIQNLSKLKFFEMNVRQSLSFFANDSFDFINARFLVGFMKPQDWPDFLLECFRLLRPGGSIRWTDTEMDISTSPSYEYFKRLVSRALWIAGQSCSVDGYHFGISPVMPRFLRAVGFEGVHLESHAIESSYGTPYHEATVLDIKIILSLLPRFLIQQQVIREDELQDLTAKILEEINDKSYAASAALFSVWGQKPF